MHAPLADAIATAGDQPAVYVLLGANHQKYTGACHNLRERLQDHHAGRAVRTKHQRPLLLVHYEYVATYEDALRKERYLKSGHGRAWLKRHIVV